MSMTDNSALYMYAATRDEYADFIFIIFSKKLLTDYKIYNNGKIEKVTHSATIKSGGDYGRHFDRVHSK
jgi:hypothetical protein